MMFCKAVGLYDGVKSLSGSKSRAKHSHTVCRTCSICLAKGLELQSMYMSMLNVDEFGLKVDTLNQFMRNVKV